MWIPAAEYCFLTVLPNGGERRLCQSLCDDDFWSGEYVRCRAAALVPYQIAKSCREERDTYSQDRGDDVEAHFIIPLSIRDLFRRSDVLSYGQRHFPHRSNPDLVLRSEQPDPASKFQQLQWG